MLGLANSKGQHCRPFNFGANKSLSVQEVIDRLSKQGVCPSVVCNSDMPFETQKLALQSIETTKLLGWKNQLSSWKALDWTLEEYLLWENPEKLRSCMWERMNFS